MMMTRTNKIDEIYTTLKIELSRKLDSRIENYCVHTYHSYMERNFESYKNM